MAARASRALQSDGNRLTFYADKFAGETLSGHSDLLGPCRVEIAGLDEVLFGDTIEQSAATLAFHQWKLTPAAEPLANPDGEGEEGESAGLESALVGKDAPDFQLDLIDGGKFKLAEQKGTVLILDFWASWCGPCMQVMPTVDKVAAEFADRGVKLVAINLQETPDQVKTALARLGLDMPVALDRDGRVAEKYGATAIPQTVIIDRQGKVARLFVGAAARSTSSSPVRSIASCPEKRISPRVKTDVLRRRRVLQHAGHLLARPDECRVLD